MTEFELALLDRLDQMNKWLYKINVKLEMVADATIHFDQEDNKRDTAELLWDISCAIEKIALKD
jgi:hypothetical protein